MISKNLKKSLIKRGLIMFSIIPLVLAFWAIGADKFNWNVIDSGRYSAVCLMFILASFILSPLIFPSNSKERIIGYIYYWVVVSTLFNISWQIPLILFRDIITNAEISHENLYKFIAWWGYGFADTHYGKVSDWMISEEIWWFLAIVISVIGIWKIKIGREITGFMLLGVGELFKFYNASLYMVYDTVTGFQNIPNPDWVSWLLYWGFNPLWSTCALMAGIFSLQIVHRKATEGAAIKNTQK